jgi:hypothetical protein
VQGAGFGHQKAASNLISDFIILLDRSIKPGDIISPGNTFGWITALGARYVQVITRDGIEYLIPNETFITERLANCPMRIKRTACRSRSSSSPCPCRSFKWRGRYERRSAGEGARLPFAGTRR